MALWKLNGKILGDERGAVELLGGIQSVAHKISAIERFLPHTIFEPKDQCLEVLGEARRINQFRNDLAHGIYAEHSDGTLWLHVGHTDPTREDKRKRSTHLTVEVIFERSERAYELGKSIYVEFFDLDPHNPTNIPLTFLHKLPPMR